MRLKQIISESAYRRGNVILVDFQPAYNSDQWGYRPALKKACEYINNNNVNVVAFFNGMDVGIEDLEDEVIDHYVEEGGLDYDHAHKIQLVEKTYAFLRGWMDMGVSNRAIIQTLRYMVNNKINDSRDVEEETLQQIVGDEWKDGMVDDMIYLPDIDLKLLKGMSHCMIGGGGRSACLKELTILMNAFNIKYKLVNDWIYG